MDGFNHEIVQLDDNQWDFQLDLTPRIIDAIYSLSPQMSPYLTFEVILINCQIKLKIPIDIINVHRLYHFIWMIWGDNEI